MKHRAEATRRTFAIIGDNCEMHRLYQHRSTTTAGTTYWEGQARVLWSRRRDGVLRVYQGVLRGYQPERADSVGEWMNNYIHPVDVRIEDSFDGRQFRDNGYTDHSTANRLIEFHDSDGRELPDNWIGWWTPAYVAPRGRGYGHIAGDDPHLALCGVWVPLLGPLAEDGTSGQATCPVCEAAR